MENNTSSAKKDQEMLPASSSSLYACLSGNDLDSRSNSSQNQFSAPIKKITKLKWIIASDSARFDG